MMTPDLAMIAEVMLAAEGFREARILAKKTVTLYSLMIQQLSKQVCFCRSMPVVISTIMFARQHSESTGRAVRHHTHDKGKRIYSMPENVCCRLLATTKNALYHPHIHTYRIAGNNNGNDRSSGSSSSSTDGSHRSTYGDALLFDEHSRGLVCNRFSRDSHRCGCNLHFVFHLRDQDHYDYGLRNLKAVLNMAGALKRADPTMNEEAILMRALR